MQMNNVDMHCPKIVFNEFEINGSVYQIKLRQIDVTVTHILAPVYVYRGNYEIFWYYYTTKKVILIKSNVAVK